MPKIHRLRGVTVEGQPAPPPVDPALEAVHVDDVHTSGPVPGTEPIVVDEHGDDAAAVAAPAPARRKR